MFFCFFQVQIFNTAELTSCRTPFMQGPKPLCPKNSPVISVNTLVSAISTRVRSRARSKKAAPNAQNPRFERILKSERVRAPKPSSSPTKGHFKRLLLCIKAVSIERGRSLGEAMVQDGELSRRNFAALVSASHPGEPEPAPGPEQRESWLKHSGQNFLPSSDFKPSQI